MRSDCWSSAADCDFEAGGLLYSDHDYTEEAYNNTDFKVVDGKFDVMFFY